MNRDNKAETIDAQGSALSAKQDTPNAVEGAGSALPKPLTFTINVNTDNVEVEGRSATPQVFTPVVHVAYPPIIEEIEKVFGPLRGKPILYAWGNIIYNPTAHSITKQLYIHEATHGLRQGAQVEEWWKHYLANPTFRLEEEIEAHREEYRAFCFLNPDRNLRDLYRRRVAQRLAGPLYGRLITYTEALKVVK